MNRIRLTKPRQLITSILLGTIAAAHGQTTYVTTFGEGTLGIDGWKSDDTRSSAGTNLIGTNFTHGGTGAAVVGDDALIANQLDWVSDFLGTRGNLGGLRFDGTMTGSGKSTLSVIQPAAGGLGLAELLDDANFSVNYRWRKDDNAAAAGVSLKLGIQSTAWGATAGASQNGFTPLRSGETVWDLVLVFDPTNNYPSGTSYQQNQSYSHTITANSGRWFLYDQAGNNYFDSTVAPIPGNSNPPNNGKTLAEWLSDPTWGAAIRGGTISNTQFGVGSENQNTVATLDYARISFLNGGNLIDFSDAARWTGGASGNFLSTANWSDNTAPGAGKNAVIDRGIGSLTDLQIEAAITANVRSLGVGSGNVALQLENGASLVANNDGFLSAEVGAKLQITGGTITAATAEAWGDVEITDSTVALDGGSVNQPVRGGRYGVVVGPGGNLTLGGDAAVSVTNAGAGTVVRIGEGEGATAKLTVKDGASITVGTSTNLGSFQVGDFGSSGEVTQTGGLVEVIGSINLGNRSSANRGSEGTYNLAGGTLRLQGGLYAMGRTVGADPFAASGVLNLSGGLLDVVDGNFIIGDRDSTGLHGTGTLNQTGGILRIGAGASTGLFIAGYGGGIYNLSGGTLEVGGSGLQSNYNNSATYVFNLGGGTIKVIGSDLTMTAAVTTQAGTTSIIDTNNLNATFQGPITGFGSIVKKGEGSWTMADVAALGALTVEQGNVVVGNDVSAGGEVNIADGAAITATSGGAFTLESTAILRGTGLLDAPTVVRGQVAAGASPGVLTIDADFTLASGSRFVWELADESTSLPGTNYDQLLVTGGAFVIAPGAEFEFSFGGGVDFAGAFWDAAQSWTVIAAADADSVSNAGFDLINETNPQGSFSLAQEGSDVVVNWQPVPEPGSAMLLLTALGFFGARRSRPKAVRE